ncbi:hypothetical protein MMC17_009969 [Xylographa soralifera]|nr:hypothetical protein [Xylographa soralifera]
MSVFSAKNISRAAKPISAVEFYTALCDAWRPRNEGTVQTLGLAISGGVDSMALAYLCQSMKRLDTVDRDGLKFRFRAFVVDHKARDGSTDEANLVMKRLRTLGEAVKQQWAAEKSLLMKVLGVKSRVLNMDWPQESNPSKITNFESEARRLRYRLLGQACRQQSIESLLLAHHADDQAETVLVRLSRGHKITGLQAMQQSADIPECWGIHGLCRSGGCGHKTDYSPCRSVNSRATSNITFDTRSIQNECGGISLYRPLLSFAKERLIATCLAEGVEWVEDKTNQDPTVTTRNTARQLLISGRLPVALQKPSMIALAKSAHSRVVELEKSAERLLYTCDILSFDNRVGSLVVLFSKEMTSFDVFGLCTRDEIRRREIEHLSSVGILLRRLMELVSPLETVRLQSLQAVATAVCASKDMSLGLTAGGVRFQRSELAASDLGGRPWQFSSTSTSKDNRPYSRRDTSDKQNIWTLSRQPYHSNTLPSTILVLKQQATKNFVLWDGRFWIHLQNDTPYDICVRPLRWSDLADQLSPKFSKANRDLGAILRKAAPGRIRWTLPVIAFANHVILPLGEQRVIALPSLHITFGKHSSLIKWAIRYKKVDLERCPRKVKVDEKLEPNDTMHGDMLVDPDVNEAVPSI